MDARTNEERLFQIVCGLDFSAFGDEALRVARDMGKHNPSAVLHVVHVVHPPVGIVGVLGAPTDTGPNMMALFEHARAELERTCGELERHLPGRVHGHVCAGEAGHEINQLARELGADLIVVGTHGRSGLGRVLLGSIATNVTKHAPCSVLVVRRPAPTLDRPLASDDHARPPH